MIGEQGLRRATLSRYILGVGGPALLAAAHFAASWACLALLAPRDFGLFSFSMVIMNLGLGFSNALFCAPLAVNVNSGDETVRLAADACFAANQLYFLIFGAVAAATLAIVGASANEAGTIGLYCSVMMLRWFARSYFFAVHEPRRAFLSDLIYSASLGSYIAYIVGIASESHLSDLFRGFLLASVAASLPFGAGLLRRQFQWIRAVVLHEYLPIWRAQARWALLGVITAEATSNAHAYLVTLLAGPEAFSLLAAASLFFRPVSVCSTALSQVERPVIARDVSALDWASLHHTVLWFRGCLLLIWAVSSILTALVFYFHPTLVARFDPVELSVATLVWAFIVAVRAIRVPESVLLQAVNRFRALAVGSCKSAIVSTVAASVLLVTWGATFSLVGIFLGDLTYLMSLLRISREWKQENEDSDRHRNLQTAR